MNPCYNGFISYLGGYLMEEKEELTCENCMKTSSDVSICNDPYMEEIYYLECKRALCDSCYLEISMDIQEG